MSMDLLTSDMPLRVNTGFSSTTILRVIALTIEKNCITGIYEKNEESKENECYLY